MFSYHLAFPIDITHTKSIHFIRLIFPSLLCSHMQFPGRFFYGRDFWFARCWIFGVLSIRLTWCKIIINNKVCQIWIFFYFCECVWSERKRESIFALHMTKCTEVFVRSHLFVSAFLQHGNGISRASLIWHPIMYHNFAVCSWKEEILNEYLFAASAVYFYILDRICCNKNTDWFQNSKRFFEYTRKMPSPTRTCRSFIFFRVSFCFVYFSLACVFIRRSERSIAIDTAN